MAEIPLQRLGDVAIVDDADMAAVGHFAWHDNARGYVVRFVGSAPNRKVIYLHRQIMMPPPGLDVDHVSGDRHDNRRCNLRLATRAQNLWNTGKRTRAATSSRFKGVYFCRQTGRFAAHITVAGVDLWLGRHDTEIDAALAYNAAVAEHHGEFGRPNIIPERQE